MKNSMWLVALALVAACKEGSSSASAQNAWPKGVTVEGSAPDGFGVAHDDVRHVTCWYEWWCPSNISTQGCSTAMSCLPDKQP